MAAAAPAGAVARVVSQQAMHGRAEDVANTRRPAAPETVDDRNVDVPRVIAYAVEGEAGVRRGAVTASDASGGGIVVHPSTDGGEFAVADSSVRRPHDEPFDVDVVGDEVTPPARVQPDVAGVDVDHLNAEGLETGDDATRHEPAHVRHAVDLRQVNAQHPAGVEERHRLRVSYRSPRVARPVAVERHGDDASTVGDRLVSVLTKRYVPGGNGTGFIHWSCDLYLMVIVEPETGFIL